MKIRNVLLTIILVMILSITVGFSAFVSEMSISNIVADVRVETDVRITGISITGGSVSGGYNNLNWDTDSVILGDLINNKGDYVNLEITVTNIGSAEVGIYDVIVPEGIDFEIANYNIESKICDTSNKCNLGINKTLQFKVSNSGYTDTGEGVKIDFDFRQFYKVTYIGFEDVSSYPTEVIGGGNLDIYFASNAPNFVVARNSISDIESTYFNGEFFVQNITSDIEVEAFSGVYTFDFTGTSQTFTVPYDGLYRIHLWGAQGGSDGSQGGLGAYTSGVIELKKGKMLYIYVGQNGGVFNNGGHTRYYEWLTNTGYFCAGGGATDVRLVGGAWNNFSSLASRIMVAAAGGGASSYYAKHDGGAAGGLIGYSGGITGSSGILSTGGSQTSGGNHGITSLGSASFGHAFYDTAVSLDAGGGSGYYAGGNGAHGGNTVGSGAGGSSFISGHFGCDAISESSTESAIVHTGQSVHYSGYQFTATSMIDGNGYSWFEYKDSYFGMPSKDGTQTVTGNTGNGYAKIALIELQ